MTTFLETIIADLFRGNRVLAPGPGHSEEDRSLSIWPAKNTDGFTVHSFAGDDQQACIAYVKALLDPEKRAALAALGVALPARDVVECAEDDPLGKGWYARWLARKAESPRVPEKRHPALDIWDESVSPAKTIVEVYLWQERHLDLPEDIGGDVIRYHPECPWTDAAGKVLRVPCMVAAMRDIRTNKIVAIQRTRLSPVGQKIDRRMWGPAGGAAIKLDADVLGGLHVGEGVETALTARQLSLRPVWALGSKGEIGKFPALDGVGALTILAEPGAETEVRECAERWHRAGKEVLLNRSKTGSDLNDAWRGVA